MKKKLLTLLLLLSVTGAICTIVYAATLDTIDMETGDESQWDNENDADGDITTTAGAALAGTNYGLDIRINDTTVLYKRETQADTGTRHFRLRFYIDPNSLTMANYDEFDIVQWAINPSPYYIFRFTMKEDNADNKFIDFRYYTDAGPSSPDTAAISDAPHYVEVYILQASSDVAGDGSVTWYLDGNKEGEWLGTLDNYDVFAGGVEWRAGGISGVDAGTSGAFFMDEFVTRDANDPIGAYTPAGGQVYNRRPGGGIGSGIW